MVIRKIECVFLFLFTCVYLTTGQVKYALVIAVGDYPDSNGFKKINSQNDIAILNAPLKSLGLEDKNIIILSDQQATKSNIINKFKYLTESKLNPGDFFYFHFSGHGQQVEDKNGDELDGLDEALVPYDAKSELEPGIYEGENHLIDDSLQILLAEVRKKIGPKGHVLSNIDACHSGTSTRGFGISRGASNPLGTPSINRNTNKKQNESNSEKTNIDETQLASMISFYASRSNQLNYEIIAEDGKHYGALSYAFSKAFVSLTANASYQQLFDKIRLHIQQHNNSQIPEAEGELNQTILDGQYLEPTQYFLVKEIKSENLVIIDGGFLQGLREKSIVGFYQPESRNIYSDKPIYTGIIQSCRANSCEILIDSLQPSQFDIADCWIKVKEESYGDLSIDILDQTYDTSVARLTIDSIFKLSFINKVNTNADLVLTEDQNNILIFNCCDVLIEMVSKKKNLHEQYLGIRKAIGKFGQTQFIKELNQENKDINIRFELVLVNQGIRHRRNNADEIIKSADGRLIFKSGDTIRVKVTNMGTKKGYYSLLDIQPDYQMNVLIPEKMKSPTEYFLEPGESKLLPTSYALSPPLGQELFKMIASKNAIDLRPLNTTRSLQNISDPFEKIISLSYYENETATRGSLNSLPSGQVNIFSVPFDIEE